MRLTIKALDQISTSVRAKNRLALELDCSVFTIGRHLNDNKRNNDLTKAAALKVIREETGLSDDEILEEDSVDEPATV